MAVLLSGLFAIVIFGSYGSSRIQDTMRMMFSNPDLKDQTIHGFMTFVQHTVLSFIIIIGPLLAAVFIAAVLSNVMQVGFMLSGELIKPKLSKLNPIKGLERLFSVQSLAELAKSLLKLIIVGGTAYITISKEMENVSLTGELELGSIFYYILVTFFKIFLKCSLAMVALAAIDYGFQRWEFEKKSE